MIDHYDAFISYRHSEQDILVAGRIQSDLEHFHIPSKIRKATGKKRIDRIFLDKDELGAASNLSSDISEALDKSEHLIVICSTATKESSWVTREIEYFLRNHTLSQVTTVLVNGEPEDVIPDILQYIERTITASDGSVHTVRIPQEPLSCDYRLPRRKAKKEELPRLPTGNSVLLILSDEIILVDLNSDTTKKLTVPSDWLTAFHAYDAGRDVLAISNKTEIRFIPLNGGEELTISDVSNPLGMYFFTDEKNEDKHYLLVPSADGYLYRYNAENGALLGQSDLTTTGNWDVNAGFRTDSENGLLYFQLGDTLDIIETETWYEETSIQRCLGYHAPGDRFYVYSHPDETVYTMGYFEHYSVDDLINKAKDMLKDNEMPDQVKAEYGIEITEE